MEQPVGYDGHMRHPQMAHPHPMDSYLVAHPPLEMTDFYQHHHPSLEEYEEYAENLSRPRLTKDQVDTLESQFQAHPKPNSDTKRQLAMQTNLTLPRVAVCEQIYIIILPDNLPSLPFTMTSGESES